jgi:hypothetical protein
MEIGRDLRAGEPTYETEAKVSEFQKRIDAAPRKRL